MSEQLPRESDQAWLDAGFKPSEVMRWKMCGVTDLDEALEYTTEEQFSLDDAETWRSEAGIEACFAVSWRNNGFTPVQAGQWASAWDATDPNVLEAEVAREWVDAGIALADFATWVEVGESDIYQPEDLASVLSTGLSADEVRRWQKVPLWITTNETLFAALADGLDPSDPANTERIEELLSADDDEEPVKYYITLEDIVKWRSASFDPEIDEAWIKAFLSDGDGAIAWRSADFSPSDAIAWREAVVDVEDAVSWRDAGFTLEEAKQFEDEGIYEPSEALELTGRSVPSTPKAPSANQSYLLRPVATLANNISEIMGAYAEFRPESDRVQALRSAMGSVLSPGDCQEVIDYFDGKWDDRAGEGDGQKLANGTVETCEAFFQRSVRQYSRNARRARMDVVALAEDIGTDPDFVETFENGVRRMDPDGTGALVAEAMVMVGKAASRSWTRTGRKIKVEQAIRVFRTLERRAGPSPQGLWCDAVADALQSQLYRF